MGCLVLLLLLFLPVAEIQVMSLAAQRIGFWNTVFCFFASAFLGVTLAKAQGRAVLLKAQQCLSSGTMPAAEMLDGFLILTGGVLFVIPGFMTDALGLILVFPPTRWLVKWILLRKIKVVGRTSAGRGQRKYSADRNEKPQEVNRQHSRGNVQDAEIVE